MNVPFCLWLWRRAKKHGDAVEFMVHEAFPRVSKDPGGSMGPRWCIA